MSGKPEHSAGKEQAHKEFIAKRPPRVRFAKEIRDAAGEDEERRLNYLEFMTSLMEMHPMVPFELCSFGSNLLDARRSLAYHVMIRQLSHTRSFIANVNIRNRTGMGTSLRCMLEMIAFTDFFSDNKRLNDCEMLERFVTGMVFLGGNWASGSWWEFERTWMNDHNEPMPEHKKDFIKKILGLPRLKEFLNPSVSQDAGFSYLYSRYSEFVHPAFGRPRSDFEEVLGISDPHRFGCKEYFKSEVETGAPISLILRDIGVACMCMEFFWVKALHIDPYSDESLAPQISQIIQEAGGSS
jgi:hypothetical protein